MRLIRSLLFSLNMIVSTIIVTVTLVLLVPLPFRLRSRTVRVYAHYNIVALKILCGIRYEIHGEENIPQETSIILSKHQSTWETFALQVIFPPLVYVVKRELLWVPFFGWGLAALNAIAIDRSAGRAAMRQVVTQGINRLKNNLWIVIFPEGTRVPPGQKGRYHMGGAVLATKSGYPVVPVAHNAGEFWPKGQLVKTPGTIHVLIGPPIPTQGRKPADVLKDTEQWIENAMADIAKR